MEQQQKATLENRITEDEARFLGKFSGELCFVIDSKRAEALLGSKYSAFWEAYAAEDPEGAYLFNNGKEPQEGNIGENLGQDEKRDREEITDRKSYHFDHVQSLAIRVYKNAWRSIPAW